MILTIGQTAYPSLKGHVSDEEWNTRVQLAALFRLVPIMGWDDLSNQLCAARVGQHFLVGPHGVLFEEVTASSLVKVDIEGRVVDETPFTPGTNLWHPMRAVFEARPDAHTVIHTHDDYITAVAAQAQGLLPISQSAAFAMAAGLAYHTYEGVETYAERMPSLQKSLGPSNLTLILRNHGVVTLGASVPAAFMLHHIVRKACRTQVMAGANTEAELIHLSDSMVESFKFELQRASQGDGTNVAWPGLLRKLERQDPGFMD
jgi:ribulose-5-phosphate 4-epimerase/fuculose-1-phosphate aldolase